MIRQAFGGPFAESSRKLRIASCDITGELDWGLQGKSRQGRGFWAPKSGLRGVPVGTAANALWANGLSPFFKASAPVAVNIPHLKRSRRVIWP
jgi:hypothetical protein